ncbi:MAG: TrkA family potassium uptake protein [Bacillota bacterium]
MKVVVVGGGKVGYYLAKTLIENRHQVSLIENVPEKAKRLAEELEILVICGDGTNQYDLADAGCDSADIVAAVTGRDEVNLIVCQVARKYFSLKKVIARVNNPRNQELFETLGVDLTVSSTAIIAEMVERDMVLDSVRTLFTFDRADLVLVEVDIGDSSGARGKSVKDLAQDLPVNCVLVAVIRGQQAILPRGDTVLNSGDLVMAMTSPESQDELRRALIGKGEQA